MEENELMFQLDITNHNYQQTKYPAISDELIKSLQADYPNTIPLKYVDDYEQGKLAGQQEVINKLIAEKTFNENEATEED